MKIWAHPIEVRKRAVAAAAAGKHTVAEVAALFGVGERTIYTWQRQLRDGGSLEPLPHKSGNKPRVDEAGAAVVRQIIADEPDATVTETTVYFVERTRQRCSRAAMGRALRRLGLTRKKSR